MDSFELFILALAGEYGYALWVPPVQSEIVRHLDDRLMNRINRNIQIAILAHLIEKVYLSLQQSRVDEF